MLSKIRHEVNFKKSENTFLKNGMTTRKIWGGSDYVSCGWNQTPQVFIENYQTREFYFFLLLKIFLLIFVTLSHRKELFHCNLSKSTIIQVFLVSLKSVFTDSHTVPKVHIWSKYKNLKSKTGKKSVKVMFEHSETEGFSGLICIQGCTGKMEHFKPFV